MARPTPFGAARPTMMRASLRARRPGHTAREELVRAKLTAGSGTPWSGALPGTVLAAPASPEATGASRARTRQPDGSPATSNRGSRRPRAGRPRPSAWTPAAARPGAQCRPRSLPWSPPRTRSQRRGPRTGFAVWPPERARSVCSPSWRGNPSASTTTPPAGRSARAAAAPWRCPAPPTRAGCTAPSSGRRSHRSTW